MSDYQKPLWLKEIIGNNKNLGMKSFVPNDFIVVNKKRINNKKIKVAVLRDGPFIPVITGAAASILGIMNSLLKKNIGVILIKCLRESDDIELYKKQNFTTFFIDEESFYSGKKNILRDILIKQNINIVHFDSAEAVNIQSKFVPKNIHKVFDVQNIEYDLLEQNKAEAKTIDYIKKQEKDAFYNADAIMFRSIENMNSFRKLGIKNIESKSSIYRGGIYGKDIVFNKERYLSGGDILFLGHLNYEPNIQALRIIKKFILPYIKQKIIAVGDCGQSVKAELKDDNMKFLGRADDLNQAFDKCSVALCPLITGSGTRLKILDYLMAGLPTIGTTISVEGLEDEIKKHMIIEDDFTKYAYHINNIKNTYNPQKSISAMNYVFKNRTWYNIIGDVISVYEKSISQQ